MMRGTLIGIVGLCVAMAAPCSNAEPILVDQSFTPSFLSSSSSVTLGARVAQTFTVGLNGQLNSASVAIVGSPPTTCTTCFLDVDIQRTYAGAPLSSPNSVLAHIRIPTSVLPQRAIEGPDDYFVFDLSSFELFVSPGDRLAIVFTAISLVANTPYRDMAALRGCHSGSCRPYGDPYPGGEMWFMNEGAGIPWTPISKGRPEFNDIAFQTFVSPGHISEPASLALLGFGLGCFSFFARGKGKGS